MMGLTRKFLRLGASVLLLASASAIPALADGVRSAMDIRK